MKLNTLIAKKRSSIMERWFDLIVDTYPSDTSRFLKKQKDRFANPVGHAIHQGMQGILDELIKGPLTPDEVSPFLDKIIRVRAIQDFSPSQALSFLHQLKKVIREEIETEDKEYPSTELSDFESNIDELVLLSFDIYMKCREKIYELKANEIKNRTYKLLKRANLIWESPEQKTDMEISNNDSQT